MDQSLWTQFLVVAVILIGVGFSLSALYSPPDPYTQVRTIPIILLVALPVSYWLVYRQGLPF